LRRHVRLEGNRRLSQQVCLVRKDPSCPGSPPIATRHPPNARSWSLTTGLRPLATAVTTIVACGLQRKLTTRTEIARDQLLGFQIGRFRLFLKTIDYSERIYFIKICKNRGLRA
jgi:hypothetical protein